MICHCLVIDRTVRMVATGCSAARREDSPFARVFACVNIAQRVWSLRIEELDDMYWRGRAPGARRV